MNGKELSCAFMYRDNNNNKVVGTWFFSENVKTMKNKKKSKYGLSCTMKKWMSQFI